MKAKAHESLKQIQTLEEGDSGGDSVDGIAYRGNRNCGGNDVGRSGIDLDARLITRCKVRNFGPPSESDQWDEKNVLSGGQFITPSR